MDDLKIMCRVITPYICPICNQETLFFLEKKNSLNHLIDYKLLINKQITFNELRNNLSSKRIDSIKCISCNKQFIMDWRTGFPIPLVDESVLIQFGQNTKH